jgi:hypothetical protein
MKLPFTISIILLLVGQIVLAQNTKANMNKISGTVTDEINLPIPNATITIYDNTKLYQTQTDSSGNYCLANIPNGGYNLKINYLNLVPMNDTLLLDGSNTNRFVKNVFPSNWGYYIDGVRVEGVTFGCGIEIYKPIEQTFVRFNNAAPNQNINAIAAYMRGVDSRNGETPSIMGARPENTGYYLDGVRLAGMDQSLTIIGK